MTTALCFYCGETKFGAWCTCMKCGTASSGDRNLDILLSDHRMSVATLERFGGIIKQIAQHSDDPEIRFWAFLCYLSSHPAQLLSATLPSEIADRVEFLLAQIELPVVAAELKEPPKETGPPQRTIAFPEGLLQKYANENKLHGIDSVQVRRRDGVVVKGFLLVLGGSPQLMFGANIEMLPDEIVAVRTAPGCLFGWLKKARWIEADQQS